MKNLLIIASILCLNYSVSARSNDEDNKFISQALKISEPSPGSVSPNKTTDNQANEKPEMTKETKNVEVDSSYYSVNKFNFLFYLMYKLKYTEEGNRIQPKKNVLLVD